MIYALQGLDALLDTLEVCPVYMCKQVLGIVADILHSNHNAKPYAVAWRSYQGSNNLAQVLNKQLIQSRID
jgi:hypothetical protein